MVMQRWDPLREFRRMEETMNRLARGFSLADEGVEAWAVPLDVIENGNNIVVRASVPGVKPEDIDVSIEDGVLTIRGETREEREEREANFLMRERRFGRFHRALRLPETVDTDRAETKYENGVLSINFPKVAAKKAKRLEIKAG